MNFPVFGDAGANDLKGKACAAIIENGASVFSCPDIYPLAKVAYFAWPFYVSKDPVIVDHITLAMKILVFILFAAVAMSTLRALFAADRSIVPTERQFRISAAWISVLLIAICINNIPVRLTDLEAACCATIATLFALSTLRAATQQGVINYWSIFWACFFACLGGLFKQSFFAREALLVLAFAFCVPFATLLRFLKDWRVYATVLLANVGVGLQLWYVWRQFGAIGLTEPKVMNQVATASKFPFVAMEIFTLPQNTAYMLSVQPNVSWLSWYVYKLFYALKTTDFFVYGGFGKSQGFVVSAGIGRWLIAYLVVIVFFALMIASIRHGTRAVRFVSLVALFNLLFMTAYQHIEPRYHILPKALLVVLAAYWLLRGWNRFAIAYLKRTSKPHHGPSQLDAAATPRTQS